MEPALPARLHSLRHLPHRCCYSLKTGCGGSYYHHQRNHNLLHTLLYIKRVILHFPRSTILSFPSLPDYECKSKKIISIRQISKLVLYEIPFSMYQMTKRVCHKSMTRPSFQLSAPFILQSFYNHIFIDDIGRPG